LLIRLCTLLLCTKSRRVQLSVKRPKITRSPAVAKVGRPYRLYAKTNVRLPVAERKRNPKSDCSHTGPLPHIHVIVTLLYRTIQSTLGSNTAIRRWLQAATLHRPIKLWPSRCRKRDTVDSLHKLVIAVSNSTIADL